jgi:hypothetical protein
MIGILSTSAVKEKTVYETVKVFSVQKMPDKIQQEFFKICRRDKEVGFYSYYSHRVYIETSSISHKLLSEWLVLNGAINGESILIVY